MNIKLLNCCCTSVVDVAENQAIKNYVYIYIFFILFRTIFFSSNYFCATMILLDKLRLSFIYAELDAALLHIKWIPHHGEGADEECTIN